MHAFNMWKCLYVTCVCMYMICMEKRLEGYTPNAKSNQHGGVELIFRFF